MTSGTGSPTASAKREGQMLFTTTIGPSGLHRNDVDDVDRVAGFSPGMP